MSGAMYGPSSGRSFTVTPSDVSRFLERVDVRREGCWLWTGAVTKIGYGSFTGSWRAGPTAAHRVAWTIEYGPIPAGALVCHTCDVRRCVRPDHLFLGTHLDNMRDMANKGRAGIGILSPQCRNGHYYTVNNAVQHLQPEAGRGCALCQLTQEQDGAGAKYLTALRAFESHVAEAIAPLMPSLQAASETLSQRELSILSRSLGVYGQEPESMTTLAYVHRISRQRVDQIRRAAMQRLGVDPQLLNRDLGIAFGHAAAAVNVVPERRRRRSNMKKVGVA